MSEAMIPKFNDTFLPILDVLKNGEAIHHRKLLEKVIATHYSHLPDDLMQVQTKSGEVLIENRIAWGKSYLKKGGYVFYPKRGQVQITEKGLEASKTNLTLKEVTEDSIAFYSPEAIRSREGDENGTLNKSPQDLIDLGIQQLETEVKTELLEKLRSVDPYYFEKIILKLLHKMGYGDFVETKKSGDGGIDGIINQDKLGVEKIYIQAKRYTENKVREPDIRNFIGAMSGDTTKGVFVTTSSFDSGAVNKANSAIHRIILIDGEKLASLMYEYEVGIQLRQTYTVKSLDLDFFDGD